MEDERTPARRLPGPREVAAGIYGLVVSSSVMVAGVNYYTGTKLAVAVLVTVLVYWLAERYAELLAQSVHGQRLTGAQVAHSLREGWPMVQASYAPLAVLIVADFLGARIEVAVTLALAVSTFLLAALGYVAARRIELTMGQRVISSIAAGTLGIIMIVFKFLLH